MSDLTLRAASLGLQAGEDVNYSAEQIALVGVHDGRPTRRPA